MLLGLISAATGDPLVNLYSFSETDFHHWCDSEIELMQPVIIRCINVTKSVQLVEKENKQESVRWG